MKKPLVLYGVLNRDPMILGIQNQGVLNQVPTLARVRGDMGSLFKGYQAAHKES